MARLQTARLGVPRLAPFLTVMAIAATLTGVPGSPANAAPVPAVRSASQDAAWRVIDGAAAAPASGFTGNVARCSAGTMSAAYRARELEVVNALRTVAGVGPVTENTSWSGQAQQAALMMAAAGRLSHDPATSWPCYTGAGAAAAASSNLTLGVAGPAAMLGYIEDPGASNDFVGHRRWLLCPSVTQFGFGDTPTTNATKVFGDSAGAATSQDGFVAWPSPGWVPTDVARSWGLLDRFSVQVPTPDNVANADVTITSSTGAPVAVTELVRDNQGYCSPAVVWRPSRAPAIGESWTVTVSNVLNKTTNTSQTFSYTTSFSTLTDYAPYVKAIYTDFLARPATAADVSLQTAALGDGRITRVQLVRGVATSPERVGRIVRAMYLDTLGREPDPVGQAFWVNTIVSKRFTVAQVAAQFYSSAEFFDRNARDNTTWVTALYQRLLHRQPDGVGLPFWVSRAADPAIGRTSVAYDFFQSQESRQTRVNGLYQELLQRNADPSGLSYWSGVIFSAGDLELAVNLASSQEYADRATQRFRAQP